MPTSPSRPSPIASATDGLLALVQGALFLLKERRTWPPALVPLAIALGLGAALIAWSLHTLGPWVSDALMPEASTTTARVLKSALRWGSSLVLAFAAWWAALLIAPVLAAPALERLVRLQEQALGRGARPAVGLWRSFVCELSSQVFGLLVFAPVAVATWALSALFPAAALLHGVWASLALAWNLLGYPLTLRGVRPPERIRWMRRNAPAVLVFGGAFTLLGLLPGASLFLLPVGVVGATRLCASYLDEEPLDASTKAATPS